MPYTDKIIYNNNGSGASGSAVPSTSPALPTAVTSAHMQLHNGTGVDEVPANDRIRFGTKFTYNGTTGGSNMIALPAKQTKKIVTEPFIISNSTLTEVYVDIVNYSSATATLTASEKLYDMIIFPKRAPFRLAIS